MPGDNGTRQFVKIWWVLAFIIGACSGALSATYAGIPYTVWGIVGLGFPIAVAIALLEWLGGRRASGFRLTRNRWRRPLAASAGANAHHAAPKGKLQPRRGQLHAISGRKDLNPPSSGAS